MHRSALYHHPRLCEARPVRNALRELAGEWPTYGYRRLTIMLHRRGHPVNAKRVRRLMHELGICGDAPTRRVPTTDSDHPCPRYPNLGEGLEVVRPDQVWVADITYGRMRKVDLTEYEDLAGAWRQLGRFLEDVYNLKWIHSALGYLSPSEFERQWIATRRSQ